MSFPSPYMGGGHPGMGGLPMLPGSGMHPQSPLGMPGMQGPTMQLQRRGSIGGFGGAGGSPHAMMHAGPLSAGHPGAMNPIEAQRMQVAHFHSPQGGSFGPGMHSSSLGLPPLPGQSPFPRLPASSTALGPHMHGYPGSEHSVMAMHRPQGLQHIQHPQMSAMNQSSPFPGLSPYHSGFGQSEPFGNSGASADMGIGGQMCAPQMDPETAAAYVRGSQMPMSGRLRGQSAGSGAQQASGKGNFEMEQEVTVKTKLRGRGTFSGATMGGMHDSHDISANMNSNGAEIPGSHFPMQHHMQPGPNYPGESPYSASLGYASSPYQSHGGGSYPMGRGSTPF